jgi:glycerophosphoryl diester phosphodiesterase
MVRIYAHRGASTEFPENTLPAFARAVELGAFGIELDVQLSSDGAPVVIHDDSVDRTTNGSGLVAALNLDALRRLDAGAGTLIPTLAEVLNLTEGRLHVDIEVKAADAAEAVFRETTGRADLRFVVSSFNHDVLRHVRQMSNDLELWPLTVAVSDDVLDTAVDLASPLIAPNDKFINGEIVDHIRDLGLGCWVWTVNHPTRAEALAKFGVVGVCTDDPAALIHLQRS